jgi:hypothetical protein
MKQKKENRIALLLQWAGEQKIWLLLAILLAMASGHNEIAQRKRPVHTGDKPDDGHDNAHDRDTPALMYFCDHQQINRPGKQSTPGGHEKGQHRVGSKKDATHHDEYEQKCGENPCCY